MPSQIFVNLPVKDLDKSVEFFTSLGFTFDPRFTDQNATCMIVGENIYVMLLVEKFFKTFTPKPIADAMKYTEAILALSSDSREEVDKMMNKVFKAGGIESSEKQDYGWMYSRSFQDLDGHLWEVGYMDINKMPAG
jgi:predicted lactoylglutathione lyase